jgi:hypothetical protein
VWNQSHGALRNGRGSFEPATNSPIKLPHGAGEMVVGTSIKTEFSIGRCHHDHYDVLVMLGSRNCQFTPAPGSPFTTRNPGKKRMPMLSQQVI